MSPSLQHDLRLIEPSVSPSTDANSGPVDSQRICQELKTERDQLRSELAEVKQERDAYLKALKATLPEKEYSFTEKDILSHMGQLPPLEEVIAKLKRELGN
jgi:hypothetical protein